MKISKENLSRLDDTDICNIIIALTFYIRNLSINSIAKDYQETLDKIEGKKV